jgi:hypothetical protein
MAIHAKTGQIMSTKQLEGLEGTTFHNEHTQKEK